MKTSPAATVNYRRSELPVICPGKEAEWNLHPRVFLPIKPGEAAVSCPYCGTRYVIVDDQVKSPRQETAR